MTDPITEFVSWLLDMTIMSNTMKGKPKEIDKAIRKQARRAKAQWWCTDNRLTMVQMIGMSSQPALLLRRAYVEANPVIKALIQKTAV